MAGLILRRLLVLVPLLLFVSIFSFALLDLIPGDPAAIIAGEDATPEQIAATRTRLGLDEPLLDRYRTYMDDVLHGDLGTSLITRRDVSKSFGEAIPVTLSLAGLSLIFSVLIAVPAGVFAAVRRGGLPDRALSTLSAGAIAIPPFVVGLVLIVPLAVHRSWLPATGYAKLGEGVGEWFRHLALPAAALALAPAAELSRQVRGAFVDVLAQDFIRAAKAKGLPSWMIIWKHALKNSGVPIVTVLGLQIGKVLSGAVVIEKVFAIPGFGSLSFDAVLYRDFPVIQSLILVSAVVVLLVNLLVDLSYGYFDPRTRA